MSGKKNALTALGFLGLTVGTFTYTIFSMSSTDEIAEVEKEAKGKVNLHRYMHGE